MFQSRRIIVVSCSLFGLAENIKNRI